jgi:hypothetical protein
MEIPGWGKAAAENIFMVFSSRFDFGEGARLETLLAPSVTGNECPTEYATSVPGKKPSIAALFVT